ncbi:hypothetical protein ACTJJ0_31905 [Chitinophaga sp. 22321]|uniref:Uncharacterized protein n=1 Tax=Chitinophaga hostae TaxID=2831022 RepID=A0ABS5JAH4_9BACT|nr:hypothetical protein [Chitinophaga hostae]MBS0032065.1 hypothetical protein [Chitinophaga hostae]
MQQYYPLSFFEKFIHVDLQQASTEQKHPDEQFYTQAVKDIINEKNKILECTGKYLYDLRKEKQIGRFIQQSQRQLVALMNSVAKSLPAESLVDDAMPTGKNTWSNLYKILYLHLAELLAHLEQKFERYLDIDCKVPPSYHLKAQAKFREDVALLKTGFLSSDVDEQLQNVVFMPFLELTKNNYTSFPITYRQLHYLTEMNKRLFQLLDASEEQSVFPQKLHDLLLFINFNSVHYFEYWCGMITEELKTYPTFREKLERLMFLQKKISQASQKTAFVFNSRRSPLQYKMQSWLAEEIAYHKEINATSGAAHLPEELSRWKDFKVQTIFSVSQIGHILKLLLDSGIYVNKNRAEVLDFFSYFFTSVKQDSISPSSLRNNFYNDNAAVSKSVRDILMQLVNQSHKGLSVVACLMFNCFLQQF